MQIKLMHLKENAIGKLGLDYMSHCIDKIQELQLHDCKILGSDLELFVEAVGKRLTPVKMKIKKCWNTKGMYAIVELKTDEAQKE